MSHLHSTLENTYYNLIEQTFEFPQDGFEVKEKRFFFRGIDLLEIIGKYGTPLKLTYLPIISERIAEAKQYFANAMQKVNYEGGYTYCYCTKSSHFSYVLNEALKNDVHIETSSSFDIHIVRNLFEKGKITKDTFLVHNGYKRPLYVQLISDLINEGFNCLPVLDNLNELEHFKNHVKQDCNIGIRIATGEEPQSNYYTARLGIRHREIVDYYDRVISREERFHLKMLHFFIDNGIEDSLYYWSELQKCLAIYCELRKKCPTLDSLNIGGGFPVKHSLAEEFDYQYLADEIVRQVKEYCTEQGVPEPNIFSEFGSYTVADSGAALYSIIDQKKQNDVEWWNMIDSSFITTLPDTWAINQRFIMLAVNGWERPPERVNLGGLTCDSQDYYNVEAHVNNIYLPEFRRDEPLYIGFFNTGAYQNALGGYGGIQHCLIPSPKQVLVHRDTDGNIVSEVFCEEQGHEGMLKTLGYL